MDNEHLSQGRLGHSIAVLRPYAVALARQKKDGKRVKGERSMLALHRTTRCT